MPTANLDEVDVLIPADGVYAARVLVPGSDGSPSTPWPAACNIGPNPTFGERIRKVEAHLIGYRGNLYGQMPEMDFLARLRPTLAFGGLDDLLDQIGRDVEEARRVCDAE